MGSQEQASAQGGRSSTLKQAPLKETGGQLLLILPDNGKKDADSELCQGAGGRRTLL